MPFQRHNARAVPEKLTAGERSGDISGVSKKQQSKNAEVLHGKTANRPDFSHGFKDFWVKINIAFTEYSLLAAMLSSKFGRDIRRDRDW